MVSAAATKFDSCQQATRNGALVSSATVKAALTATAPVSTQTVLDLVTNHPPPAVGAGFGYPAGGFTVSGITNNADGTTSAGRITITPSGGNIGPATHLIVYADSLSGDPLLFYVDLGGSTTFLDGVPKTIDWNGSNPGIFIDVTP